MPRRTDWSRVAGKVYGRVTVIRFLRRGSSNKPIVEAICECGKKFEVRYPNLLSGCTNSCGCLESELLSKRNTTHGLSYNPLHQVWLDMNKRCYSPRFKSYHNYGGRGITVTPEWRDSPTLFIAWAEANGYDETLQLDRRDNEGNYSPDNCRFVTCQVNVNNRRMNSSNKSGYRGVFEINKTSFRASVKRGNKHILQKQGFTTAIAAAKYRDAFCRRMGIETIMNFPETKEENK